MKYRKHDIIHINTVNPINNNIIFVSVCLSLINLTLFQNINQSSKLQ